MACCTTSNAWCEMCILYHVFYESMYCWVMHSYVTCRNVCTVVYPSSWLLVYCLFLCTLCFVCFFYRWVCSLTYSSWPLNTLASAWTSRGACAGLRGAVRRLCGPCGGQTCNHCFAFARVHLEIGGKIKSRGMLPQEILRSAFCTSCFGFLL